MLHKLYLDKAVKARLRGSSAISRSKMIERETIANIATAHKMANIHKAIDKVIDMLDNPTEETKKFLNNLRLEEKREIEEENINNPPKLNEPIRKGLVERIIELRRLKMTKEEISNKLKEEGATVYSIKKVTELLNRGVEEGLIELEETIEEPKKRGRKVHERTEEELEYEIVHGKPKSTMKVKLDNKPVVVSHLFSPFHIAKQEKEKVLEKFEKLKSKY